VKGGTTWSARTGARDAGGRKSQKKLHDSPCKLRQSQSELNLASDTLVRKRDGKRKTRNFWGGNNRGSNSIVGSKNRADSNDQKQWWGSRVLIRGQKFEPKHRTKKKKKK